MATTGYYSLVQYVPDSERAEGINVAVLVFVPGANPPITMAMSENPPHLREHSGTKTPTHQHLQELSRGLLRRLNHDAPQELAAYIKSIGRETGVLRALPPRAVAIINPELTSQELRDHLVGEAPKRSRLPKSIPEFEQLIGELGMSERIHRSVEVPIPGKMLKASYVWNNGKPNVVVNAKFQDDSSAVDLACQWGGKGKLLLENPVDKQPRKLAVIYQTTNDVSSQVRRDIQTILDDFQVDGIPPDRLSGYIKRVRAEAH